MPKDKKDKEYLTIDDIKVLFKKNWGLKTFGRTAVYVYITKHGFPENTGRGRPRVWEKEKVLSWFAQQDNK